MTSRAARAVALAAALAPGIASGQAPPPVGGGEERPPPPVERPGPPPPVERRTEPEVRTSADATPGYCDYVHGVADAETALYVAPEIFGTAGAINVGEGTDGTPLGSPRGRLILGIRYDFIDLWRGLVVQGRAAADCSRYEAKAALEAAVRAGADVGAAPALAAKARVLAEALPQAEAFLARLQREVREARATIDEVDVVRLRVDQLRSEARQTVLQQQRVQQLPHGESGTLAGVLRAYREADDRFEAKEGRLRALDAWKLQVRAGYDEIFDLPQDLPFFATVELSFDIGALWVGGANSRARAGRRRWVEEDVMGADRRVSELIEQLRAVRAAERARLQEVNLLTGNLSRQLREVQALGTSRVRGYESFLFFELTRLRGEQAYLETHLAELDRLLGDVEP